MDLRAGKIDDLVWGDESLLVLDVGFAQSGNRSSGLGIGCEPPVELTFSDAKSAIIDHIKSRSASPVNFVIEAPLSVAFDNKGNPTGRRFEKRRGSHTRYWYSGPAPSTSMATLYLIQDIISQTDKPKVRLFEGFATFKPKGKSDKSKGKSDHIADVEALRRVVKRKQGEIIPPENFLNNECDSIKSLFKIIGVDAGVPPLLSPW